MAKKAMVNKSKRPQKYKVREYTRCCFRELAYKGQIPGVKKASW